ncbi:hypothetical protein D9M68_734000 [compost metagenome]
MQCFLHPLFPIPGIQRLDAVLQCVEVESLCPAQIQIPRRPRVRQAHAGRLKHSGLQIKNGLLRNIGNAQAGLHLQCSVIGLLQGSKNLEQG